LLRFMGKVEEERRLEQRMQDANWLWVLQAAVCILAA
jgi:hypothetical protein